MSFVNFICAWEDGASEKEFPSGIEVDTAVSRGSATARSQLDTARGPPTRGIYDRAGMQYLQMRGIHKPAAFRGVWYV